MLLLVAALILFGAGYKYAQVRGGDPSGEQSLVTGAADIAGAGDESGGEGNKAEKQVELVVHVAGEVQRPGVYRLEAGSRVVDAVNMAGPTDESALDYLNLAAPLQDGNQIVVYSKEELSSQPSSAGSGQVNTGTFTPAVPAAGPGTAAAGMVNINTAGQAELEQLPGIGPALAGRIIDHRTNNGPFLSPEDIMSVSGIGEKRYEQIKDRITVY